MGAPVILFPPHIMSICHIHAIGNALVDAEYAVSDALLAQMAVDKRHMTLIDAPRRAALQHFVQAQTPRQSGGGSAGNTVVALAQLGGTASYSCRVASDAFGDFYATDLARNGVASRITHSKVQQGETGSCMVLVTPDGERSMCTFLGVSAELSPKDVDTAAIAAAQVYYMEGYLAASPTGLEAALVGKASARAAGVALALTLSDVSMIRLCLPGLQAMLAGGLDYLFCNEEEAKAWCGTQDWSVVLRTFESLAKIVCITRGPMGTTVLQQGQASDVPSTSVKAVDANGAGDMFAGAFLYAHTHGQSAEQAARLGNRCAAVVVAQYGNRLTRARMQQLWQQHLQA